MNLNIKILKKILKQINPNQNFIEMYHSKWISIIHFLYSSTGYSISKVGQGGSIPKQTATRQSDLDIIFSCSDQYVRAVRLKHLYEKSIENFSKAAKVKKGDRATHIDFFKGQKIDLVLVTNKKFKHEQNQLKDFKHLNKLTLDAIKLCKHACGKAYPDKIKGNQIEKIVIANFSDEKKLPEYIEMILKLISSKYKLEYNSLFSQLNR